MSTATSAESDQRSFAMRSLLIALVLVVGISEGAAQTARVVARNAPVTSFEKTPEGNWKTTIVHSNGTHTDYIFEPRAKVEPQISVAVEKPLGRGTLVYNYTYRIENRSAAAQSIGLWFLEARRPVAFIGQTAPWRSNTKLPGDLMFMGGVRGERLEGLTPGRAESLTLESPVLPGVVRARFSGDLAQATTVPEGLNELQRRDLETISRNSSVDMQTIGPAIPAGIGESDLTAAVIAARVVLNYRPALKQSGHPYGPQLLAALEGLVNARTAAVNTTALEQLREAASIKPAPAPATTAAAFHRALSEGLRLCAEALRSQEVPIRSR